MKINSAPAYTIEDTAPALRTSKVVIHNTGQHMRALSESTYNRPIEAVVRETIANAMDASKGKVFDVQAPSMLDPHFRVRDYGVGMDEEFFLTGYAAVGFSTKRDSNDEVGGFGQGRFAAFAYGPCDAFFVRGIKNKRWFLGKVNRDANFEIYCTLQAHGDSVEPDGVEVFVPVNVADFDKFTKAVQIYTEFLGDQVNCPVERIERKGTLEGMDKSWKIVTFDDEKTNRQGSAEQFDIPARAIMGGIPYKLDLTTVFSYDADARCHAWAVDLHFPIGALALPTSREELRYDGPTLLAIKNKFKEIRKEIEQLVVDAQMHLKTDWEKWTDSSVQGLQKALGTHSSNIKQIRSADIPGIVGMQNLEKVREFEGRSTSIMQQLNIGHKAHYKVYIVDEKIWRRKFQIDATAFAETQVPGPTGLPTPPSGAVIMVEDLKGIKALGDPPYTKISSLPKPPVTPRQIVAGTGIKTTRTPQLFKWDSGLMRFGEILTPDFTVKDQVYWPMAITQIEDTYQDLLNRLSQTKYAKEIVGVPKADRKLADAAGWTPIDVALKTMCSQPDVVQGYSLYKASPAFNKYPWEDKEKLQELYFVLSKGFHLPKAEEEFEKKLRLVGPLVWNDKDIMNHLIDYMERDLKVPVKVSASTNINPETQKFFKDHLLFNGLLESRFFSKLFSKSKANVPTLLALATQAL